MMPFSLRGLQRLGDLAGDFQGLDHGQRTVGQPGREVLPVHQFHRQEAHAVGRAQAIDRCDVGMIE